MFSTRVAVLVLALVPASVFAQRGGGGRGGRMGGGEEGGHGGGSSMLRLSNGDVEEMSPIKRLIDKRKDLNLTGDQVKQLKDLESEMKTRNEHLFKQLDSLRKDMTVSGSPTDEERAKMVSDRDAVTEVVGNIRLSYNETLKRAVERLDDTQRRKADELVQQLNGEADKTLQEKLNGGRGGRDENGGGGRRGRPPAV
jgi:hypothetical protein